MFLCICNCIIIILVVMICKSTWEICFLLGIYRNICIGVYTGKIGAFFLGIVTFVEKKYAENLVVSNKKLLSLSLSL